MPLAIPPVIEQIAMGVSTLLKPNIIYAVPSVACQIGQQSAAGATLQGSLDGVSFTTLATSGAGALVTTNTATAFIKTTASDCYVIVKYAPVALVQAGSGGGGGGSSFVDGSIAAPGISFTGDPTTGFWRSASDALVIQADGGIYNAKSDGTNSDVYMRDLIVNRGGAAPGSGTIFFGSGGTHYLSFDGVRNYFTDQVAIVAGTKAAPGLCFQNSYVTGLYSRVANYIMFTVGGAEVGYWGAGQLAISSSDSPNLHWIARGPTDSTGPNLTLTNDADGVLHLLSAYGPALAIGSNPPTTGAIRLGNNNYITSRNSTNTADAILLQFYSDNILYVGSASFVTTLRGLNGVLTGNTLAPNANNSLDCGTASLRWQNIYFDTGLIQGATPSLTGTIRLSAGFSIKTRNVGNTADLNIVNYDGSIWVGDAASTLTGFQAANRVVYLISGAFTENSDGNVDLGQASTRWKNLYLSQTIALGTNPSGSGAIRLGNSYGIYSRNGANSGDLQLLLTDTNNILFLGNINNPTVLQSNFAVPGTLVNGMIWLDVSGTSPSRVASLRIRDGGATRTIATITY